MKISSTDCLSLVSNSNGIISIESIKAENLENISALIPRDRHLLVPINVQALVVPIMESGTKQDKNKSNQDLRLNNIGDQNIKQRNFEFIPERADLKTDFRESNANSDNEEYWGIVTRDREPKLSYYVVQEIYEATSLSLNDNLLEINIYPNPVSEGFLNIFSNSHNPLNISIYDLNGREVMSKKIIFDSVDISNLSKGIYTLTFSDGKKSTVKKIVVK